MKTQPTPTCAGTRLAFALLLTVASLATSARAQTDLGLTSNTEHKNVSLFLKVRNPDKLESFINDTVSAGNPQFRRFLTVEQFTARFSPSADEVRQVVAQLTAAKIDVTEISANRLSLKASGTVDALNKYFGVELHDFARSGRRYHAPVTLPQIPKAVNGVVLAVTGLNSESLYRPKLRTIAAGDRGSANARKLPSSGTTASVPGSFTVADVARLYQVDPLYKLGFHGKGRTIGIATLATFDQGDAYAYWAAVGLKVKPNRITEVQVDGGAGPDGAEETTLDVQQSGGLAPKADIIVYEAPNSDQGFLDLFVSAVIENKVDCLSVSWGAPEIATDPNLGVAQNQIFMEAAAQGISLFAASGDAGAYDINSSNYPYVFPLYTKTLTVDSPASSPYMTAAGGITLAGLQSHQYGTVNVPKDRAWGWDYLQSYFDTNYPDLGGYYGLAFPVGGGGGVSVNEDIPRYQKHLKGIKKSAANQSLIYYPNFPSTEGAEDLADLPGAFAGRNLPDISLNADPYTGYLVYFFGEMSEGNGGTSFVAPQLNGITALLGEVAHSRLGFLNPTLYRMSRHVNANSWFAPFNDITSGDNLYYKSVRGYNPATGLGSINAANLALRIILGELDDD
jgi:kumamolisin